MKIVIAPDKFKGSLSASEAAAALARGFQRVWPDAEIALCPIADGGEGTAKAMCDALGGEWVTRPVRGPLGATVSAGYAWIPTAPVPSAVIEMSAASGLVLIPPAERRAREANTFGTGELMRDAISRGAKRIIVGLGGSATTDGGIGMAAALGYEFLDGNGETMEQPTPCNLPTLERIESRNAIALPEIIAACDVQNPLLGPRGTANVFAPQKGADAEDVQFLEQASTHLATVAKRDLGNDFAETPGAGAAGGLGYGLLTFCNASIRPGFDLIAEIVNLEAAITDADLVITAEGSLDSQTLDGKGPAGVAALAKRHGKPVIAFGGRVANHPGLAEIFDAVLPIPHGPMPLEEAITNAAMLLEEAAAKAAALCRVGERLPTL
jgi:glycerate kinase